MARKAETPVADPELEELMAADDQVEEDGEAVSEEGEGTKAPTRKAQMREAFKAGKTRSEIAKEFGVKYQQVFQYTKDMAAGEGQVRSNSARVSVDVVNPETGETETISRSEAIRREWLAGKSLGQIAKQFGVAYQICFQAVKALRAQGVQGGPAKAEPTDEAETTEADEAEVEVDFDEE